MPVKRRDLLKAGLLGAGAAVVGTPATAQTGGQVTALSYTAFRHYDSSRPYVEDLSNAIYINPGDPIPGGWQPEGQPPVVYNTPGSITDPRQARFARAFAQRPTAVGEMVTVDIWAYVVGGPCNFSWTDHEHKHTHPNPPNQARADIIWWRDPQFPGQADFFARLNPPSTAGRWIRFSQWQQRSSGAVLGGRPVTVMDTHTGPQERDTGLSAVNCSVGWLQA